jgi:hypothetical protein
VVVIWTADAGASGSGAPTDATYITQIPNATLTNEQALSALATGLVKNTTGTGVLSIAASGTDYAPATATTNLLLGNGLGGFTGYGGSVCGANQYATQTNGTGGWTCASIATADLPTVPVTKGGTNLTTIATNQTWVGTAADTVTAKTLPSCSNGTTSKLLYDNATQTFSCGTDQTGGAGSANVVEVEVDFGATGNDTASTVVTGQAWVTGTSKVVCAPTMLATADRAEGAEDILVEDIDVAIHSRVASTGFTVTAHAGLGKAYGKFLFHCTGA